MQTIPFSLRALILLNKGRLEPHVSPTNLQCDEIWLATNSHLQIILADWFTEVC